MTWLFSLQTGPEGKQGEGEAGDQWTSSPGTHACITFPSPPLVKHDRWASCAVSGCIPTQGDACQPFPQQEAEGGR